MCGWKNWKVKKKQHYKMSTETIRQQFIQDIKTIVKVARGNVYRAINTTMVAAYWNIGQRIVEE